MNFRKYIKNLLALGFGLFISIAILEVFLHVYNPFPARIKGDKIILPVNQKYIYKNLEIPGLDSYIVHSKNSLGFRGEEPPENLSERKSIFTVGGSTTECTFLSDGTDWSALLAQKLKKDKPDIWLNNAGRDGHSTFGHKILLQDYLVKLKPDEIIFLVGTNDIERADLDKWDSSAIQGYSKKGNWRHKIVEYSELGSTVYNLYNIYLAHKKEIGHLNYYFTKADTITLPETQIQTELQNQQSFLKGYEARLKQIIEICKANNIKSVFVTQPALLGFGNDPITGKSLEKVKFRGRNGGLHWQIMELYNEVTRKVCKERGLQLIDLAKKMPKSTEYFYDEVHFTKAGAQKVAEIIYNEFRI